ncbi:MAG TPA: hypothetical protein VJU81_02045 [Methylomirabilota bacterium]|nr:hypothetical protein [Methylomirabilota bacterium]
MNEHCRKLLGLAFTAFALVAAPAAALAQTPTTPIPAAAPPTEGSAAGMMLMVGVLLALIIGVGIAVKIYDAKRTREEEGLALQARLSDALLLNPTLIGMPVVVSVHMPLLRKAPAVVEVSGTVLTPDAREIAVHVIQRELDGVHARLEDRIMVDPQGVRSVAA